MIYDYKLLISIILISWYLTKFEPIQWIVDSYKFKNNLLQFIWEHILCPKCLSFWITFFCTFDLLQSIFVSLCTSYLHKNT